LAKGEIEDILCPIPSPHLNQPFDYSNINFILIKYRKRYKTLSRKTTHRG